MEGESSGRFDYDSSAWPIKREGTDATIVARALMVRRAEGRGRMTEVANLSENEPRTIRTLDIETIALG